MELVSRGCSTKGCLAALQSSFVGPPSATIYTPCCGGVLPAESLGHPVSQVFQTLPVCSML